MLKSFVNGVTALMGIKVSRIPPFSLESCYNHEKWNDAVLVNLGSGSFAHPRWVNVDFENEFYGSVQKKNKFIPHDFSTLEPLPFESASVNVFYTSHVIEHLNPRVSAFFFKETFRSLKDGGCIRITCPDIDILYNAYSRGDEDCMKAPSPWLESHPSFATRFIEYFATGLVNPSSILDQIEFNARIDAEMIHDLWQSLPHDQFLDDLISRLPDNANQLYPQGHCNWFNYEKLESILLGAGFTSVCRSGYGQSSLPIMRNTNLFDNTCPGLSLYVEAFK